MAVCDYPNVDVFFFARIRVQSILTEHMFAFAGSGSVLLGHTEWEKWNKTRKLERRGTHIRVYELTS